MKKRVSRINMRVSASKKEDRINEKELDGVLRGKHAWERENVKEKRQKKSWKGRKALEEKTARDTN